MIPHVRDCRRGVWLLEQLASRPRSEVWRDAFLLRGPTCTCPATKGSTVRR